MATAIREEDPTIQDNIQDGTQTKQDADDVGCREPGLGDQAK
jgi:hypothetical protein